ncbi:MAG: energy transducer TonB [Steroidobacteraceae bacterium]
MNTHLVVFTLLAAGSLPAFSAPAGAAEDCSIRVIQSSTVFPMRSQLRGQSGIVTISVSIDNTGRATAARLLQSSGYRLLDRAATNSVRDNWQFDISGCDRNDLPTTRAVSIEYRNDEYGG